MKFIFEDTTFVPYEKMSKKQKAEEDRKARGSWNGVNPVSRAVPDKTKYDRQRDRKIPVDESLNENFVETPQEVIDEVIDLLKSYNFVLDPSFKVNPGKTWMGNVHMQVISTKEPVGLHYDLKRYVPNDLVDKLHEIGDISECPITWNFGVNRDGYVTGGIDIMKQYIEDSVVQEALSENVYAEWKPNTSYKHIKSIYDSVKADGYRAYKNNESEEMRAAMDKADKGGYTPEQRRFIRNWTEDIWRHRRKSESLKESDTVDRYEVTFYIDNNDFYNRKFVYADSKEEASSKVQSEFACKGQRAHIRSIERQEVPAQYKIWDMEESFESDRNDLHLNKLKKMNESPDAWGLPTDDELEQEVQEYRNRRKAEIQKQRAERDAVKSAYPIALDLLSIEEVEGLPKNVKKYRDYYWLRSSSNEQFYASYVWYNGLVYYDGYIADYNIYCVRPALTLSNIDSPYFELYKEYTVFDKKWIYIGGNRFLYNDRKIQSRFDADSNDYETSEIKKYLDDWLRDLQSKADKVEMTEDIHLVSNRYSPDDPGFDEYDLDDEYDTTVEEGNVFTENGKEWVWAEQEYGPVNLDLDEWAVWSARERVDIRDYFTGKNENGRNNVDIEKYTAAVKAATIAYFVVEVDTCFIDWGPCDTRNKAIEFLDSKQDDWAEDEEAYDSITNNIDNAISESFDEVIYQFPKFTSEDRSVARKDYNLSIVRETNEYTIASGSLEDIRNFADEYLGYELNDDYFIEESLCEADTDDHEFTFQCLIKNKDGSGSPLRTDVTEDAPNMQAAEKLVRAAYPNSDVQITTRKQVK